MPSPVVNIQQSNAQGVPVQIQVQQSQDPMSVEYYNKTVPIYNAVTDINPTYKQTVGSAIFEFVSRLIG